MPKLISQKLRKYNYLANSKKITIKALSVAALAGCAILGAPSAHADVVVNGDTTTVTTTLSDGTEKSIELQTTYGEGDASVTTDLTILGQEVPYTYKFDNVYGDTANADTTVTTDVTVLGQPVTFTYNYDSSTALPRQTSLSGEDITGNFIGNTATNGAGGAIYNYGRTVDIITGSFIGNYSIRETDPLYGHQLLGGGAIYNDAGGKISSIIGDFIGNYDISLSSFVAEGGAIKSFKGTIGDISGNFVGNYVTSDSSYGSRGGAIKNGNGLSTIGNISGSFIGNYATGYNTEGGAISNQAIVNNIKGDFIGNYVDGDSTALGGAIGNSYGGYYATPEIGIVDASTFIRNYAKSSGGYAAGGAISNSKSIGEIRNTSFIGNYAQGSSANGGAIYNESQDSNSTATIGDISGDFIGNYAQGANSAGGAIANIGEIGNITGDFIGNYAQSTSDFAYGGAIYNEGIIKEVSDITFIDNYVTSVSGTAYGGVIYNGKSGSFSDGYSNVSEVGYIDARIVNEDGSVYKSVYMYVAILDDREVFLTEDNLENIISEGTVENFTYYGNEGNISKSEFDAMLEQEGVSEEEWFNEMSQYGYILSSPDELLEMYGSDVMPTLETVQKLKPNITLKNSDLIGNHAESVTGEAKGGAIYNKKRTIKIAADNGKTNYISGNYTKNGDVIDDNAIYMEGGKLIFDVTNGSTIQVDDNIDGEKYSTYIVGDAQSKFVLNNKIKNSKTHLIDTNLYLTQETHLDGNDLFLHSGTLSMVNNQAGVSSLNSLTITGDTNFVADVDLANSTMDRLTAATYGTHSGNLNVVGMNLLSDAPENREITEIYFAETGLKDNVTNGLTGDWNLPTKHQTTFYTPIYKYNAVYDNREDGGYFLFTKGDKIIQEGGGTTSTGNASDAFNPSVMASPVAAQAGASATMNQTFNYAFQNADNFMNIPYLERVAIRNANKYALSPTGDATDVGTFSPIFSKQDSSSVWVKPYATFENIPLKNGPKVSNTTYGTLVGFDTALTPMKRGWERVWTGYIGYNGASQRYSGVDSTQNGGLLGGTLTLYKGNFFNATTISAGATVAENTNMYGHENFTMLLAGIGNKTGYNFEFKEGKLILQPNMLLSYTFVNTFDYTNAAGVKIKSDPLHAIQLAPGLKVIGNLKGGWQPYASVNMVWNLLDKSDVTANSVKLPEMSIKPYVQYGVGVQKRFKDNCMAFGQAMIQNGGRNGVSLTAGFRWSLGKETKPIEKVQAPQAPQQKTAQSTSVEKLKLTTQADLVQRANGGVYSSGEKKIVKQLTQNQKTALTKNSPNTTRTTMTGQLKRI